MNRLQQYATAIFLAVAFGAQTAMAQEGGSGPDFSSLTSAVDFGTVVTAIMAIAALMIVPKIASWGARKVLGFIRG